MKVFLALLFSILFIASCNSERCYRCETTYYKRYYLGGKLQSEVPQTLWRRVTLCDFTEAEARSYEEAETYEVATDTASFNNYYKTTCK